MKTGQNDLFRFVSVRGTDPIYTADPTKDLTGVDVVELLAPLEVDVGKPDPKIPGLLARITLWNGQDLAGSVLAAARHDIDAASVSTMQQLNGVLLQLPDGSTARVPEFASSAAFRDEYRGVVNSWLTLLLVNPTSVEIPEHADLLRIAHLVHLTSVNPALLGEATAIARLRSSVMLPPASWLPVGGRARRLRARHDSTLSSRAGAVAPSDRAAKIAAGKAQHAELVARRVTLESINAKSQLAYLAWKREKLAGTRRATRFAPLGRTFAGVRDLVGDLVGGQPEVSTTGRVGQPLLRLDAGFFNELDQLLTPRERQLYQEIRVGVPRPETHAEHDAGFAPERWSSEANRLCHQIKLWEEEEHTSLPVDPGKQPGADHPLVRSVGWGDLVVARERLVGYEAREIAHIENVMPGETRLREHERTRTVEQVVERETLEETESERDLETTDRYQLQSETQTTIQEDYSIQAGLNTSGKYGLTNVNTSLQAGMQQSKTEARSSSQTLAKEVVSKAVERTFERVRELRRQTITEQIRELNRHSYENVPPAAGGGQPPTDISGIYLWVEKLLEVELRHYGTRMLVEFHIPEPAISLLGAGRGSGTQPRKPAPFTLSPSDVLPENYACLTATYGAQDVEPPPALYIEVGYAWATTPNEEADEWGQDARADTIAIPRGYRPVDMTALVSAHPGRPPDIFGDPAPQHTDVFMAIGGEVVVEMQGVDYGETGQAPGAEPNEGGPMEISFDPSLNWPAGVPVVVRAAGHFDNTLVAEATVRCTRSAEALDDWQLRTWEQLRAAHEVLMQTYRSELEQQALQDFGEPDLERPEVENRRVEAEELRKWAIKAMRLETFNFDATIVEADGEQEIYPLEGDLLATVARFFEEAFEWPQASYFLYPYYWGRRSTWKMRAALEAIDSRHASFLRSGAARYIVPITPGYEERVIRYLEWEGSELDRLGPAPEGYAPQDPTLMDLWLELLLDRRPELALGSGTLNVQQGAALVTINADSNWRATDRDLGREVYIDGGLYAVASVTPYQEGVAQQITLDENFKGTNNPAASYATGSVPYGPPWVEHVPTSLVILEGRRPDLAPLGA
jgi:hypothetical protein